MFIVDFFVSLSFYVFKMKENEKLLRHLCLVECGIMLPPFSVAPRTGRRPSCLHNDKDLNDRVVVLETKTAEITEKGWQNNATLKRTQITKNFLMLPGSLRSR